MNRPHALRSALYEGRVVHSRGVPSHRFTTSLTLPLLFLDELPSLRALHPLVDLDPTPGRGRRVAAVRLRREDFLPGPATTIREAVEDAVGATGREVTGSVAMLGHLRTWGWLFNPLTLFFCFDPAGTEVHSAVLEVSNTPWHERRRYVVGPPGTHRFAKELHVSPFLPSDGTYTLRYTKPGELLQVDLAVHQPRADGPDGPDGNGRRLPPLLRASMQLRRRPLDRAALGQLLWSDPFRTARVSAGIYREALRLGLKGARVHPHPIRGHPITRGRRCG